MSAIITKAPTDIITSLIDKGGKQHLVMMKVQYGWSLRGTALHLACEYGNFGGEELLLMGNTKRGGGDTALDIANKKMHLRK